MTKRISLALALAAFAMVAAATATPLTSNVADVAMKRHCIPNNVRCIAPAKPVCLKSRGPFKCCLVWDCRRYKK